MKTTNKYFISGLFLLAMAAGVSGCKDNFVSPASPTGTTVGSLITANADLKILKAALDKTNQFASLANNNSGSFTLFAPTDSAFLVYFQGKLTKPAYTVDSVLLYITNMTTSTTVKISDLNTIVTYAQVSSNLPAAALTGAGQAFTTLNGARLSVSKVGSTVYLNANLASGGFIGAKVKSTDDLGSNGVIHTINRVLLPGSTASAAAQLGVSVSYSTNPATVTVSGTATNFNIFANAIAVTGLAPTILPNISPLPDYTLFAPADANFVAWLQTTYASAGITNEATAITFVKGLNANTTPTLAAFTDIIKKHVVAGRYVSTDFNDLSVNSQETGYSVVLQSAGTVNGVAVATKDQLTNAGVVHVISNVLN